MQSLRKLLPICHLEKDPRYLAVLRSHATDVSRV